MQENELLQSEQHQAIVRTQELFNQIIEHVNEFGTGMGHINQLNDNMSENRDSVVKRMEIIAQVSEQSAAATASLF